MGEVMKRAEIVQLREDKLEDLGRPAPGKGLPGAWAARNLCDTRDRVIVRLCDELLRCDMRPLICPLLGVEDSETTMDPCPACGATLADGVCQAIE